MEKVRMRAIRPLSGNYTDTYRGRSTPPGTEFDCDEKTARSLESRNLAERVLKPQHIQRTVSKILELRRQNEQKMRAHVAENKMLDKGAPENKDDKDEGSSGGEPKKPTATRRKAPAKRPRKPPRKPSASRSKKE